MCTLIVIHRRVRGRWLLVAANRDEYLDRPSEGPGLRSGKNGRILAPLDVRAGGTWLGLNTNGVFAALTNLSHPDNNPDRASRGEIVMQALETNAAAVAASRFEKMESSRYNPFNCFVCDQDQAFLVVYKEEPNVVALEPGVHVIVNANPLEPPVRKADLLRQRVVSNLEGAEENLLLAMGDLCREHGLGNNTLDDPCVHAQDLYGTRSSILLELKDGSENRDEENHLSRLGQEGENPVGRLFYADGPPCGANYEDLSPLLQELRQPPGY